MKVKVPLFFLLLTFAFGCVLSQNRDSIILNVRLDTLENKLYVEQDFFLVNKTSKILNEIFFHAWANAYTGRFTELNRTKLQDRKGSLHFSQKEDRGGVANFSFQDSNGNSLDFEVSEREFFKIKLNQPWMRNENIHLKVHYTVKIPFDAVTRYGRNENGDYLLKYFFLQPATMNPEGNWNLQHFKDFEALAAYPGYYELKFDYPKNFTMFSDLEKSGNTWVGNNMEHFRIYLTQDQNKSHLFYDKQSQLEIDFGYELDSVEKPIIDSILPAQLTFLEKHLGKIPGNHLFISSKTKKEQNFFGVDDLDAWIMQIKLFTEEEQNSLKLFQQLSYEYIDRLFAVNKINDHWLKNGLQMYLQMKFVDEFFPHLKLAGHFPDNFKILGTRPLNFFHAAKLKMNDRYKLVYLYLARQNYDQPINTPYDQLSNMNQIAMSGFKTGLTFYYMDEYLGDGVFSNMIQGFSIENRGKITSRLEFRNYILENSPKNLSWFFDDYIDKKEKINFKLAKISEESDSLQIKIKNRTEFAGPFQVVAYNKGIPVKEQWYIMQERKGEIHFPKGEYTKIELNPGYLFPEFNDHDNYMKTKGLFRNSKKIQFKLYSDVDNPEFAQIFMNPQVRWNNYDKFLIGMKFHNQSLLTRPFKWNISPKFSTGTGKLAGSANAQNTFMPESGWFRSITIGGGFKYEHYDVGLTYLKWYTSIGTNFAKKPRESLSHGFLFNYDNLDKEVPRGEFQTDENKYGLWNFTYYYSKPDYINESFGAVTFQTAGVFQKLYGEFYYRWRYAPKKQLGLRLFAGVFTNNEANTDYFNFGVSKVSDYAFNFNLLGRSESSGILSQQYVLAEAGFKSQLGFTVNQWVIATNVEFPLLNILDLYADAAVYQNKSHDPKFIYDTGIKFKIIPDFLEFYLPVQSSLGFEPAMDKYWERIRFTFNFNLSSIINYLRRGWY